MLEWPLTCTATNMGLSLHSIVFCDPRSIITREHMQTPNSDTGVWGKESKIYQSINFASNPFTMVSNAPTLYAVFSVLRFSHTHTKKVMFLHVPDLCNWISTGIIKTSMTLLLHFQFSRYCLTQLHSEKPITLSKNCCWTQTISKSNRKVGGWRHLLIPWLMNANTALPASVRSKKFCFSLNRRAGNCWEMTLKNVVPSICLSQWLIAGFGECSILMLHKGDLRLFHSCVGGKKKKNSWCIWETLEGGLLI